MDYTKYMDLFPRKYTLTILSALVLVLMGVMSVSLANSNKAMSEASYASSVMPTETPSPTVTPTKVPSKAPANR